MDKYIEEIVTNVVEAVDKVIKEEGMFYTGDCQISGLVERYDPDPDCEISDIINEILIKKYNYVEFRSEYGDMVYGITNKNVDWR